MRAIDRLYQYFDYKDIKPTRFEKDFGFSNGYFGTQKRRNANLGEDILNKIIDNCLDLSVEWLLTGKGEMLIISTSKSESLDNVLVAEENQRNSLALEEKNKALEEESQELKLDKKFLQEALTDKDKIIALLERNLELLEEKRKVKSKTQKTEVAK